MKMEGRKQWKFKHYILAPFRILNKARQVYMKGVVECAGGYGYGGIGTLSPVVRYIQPLSAEDNSGNLNSLRKSGGGDGEGQSDKAELNQLIKNAENNNETRLVVQRQRRKQFVGYDYNRNKMSYSSGVRKIGRIEEGQPCYFEEDQIDVKTHLLYLYPRRSRSNCVNKKSTLLSMKIED